MKILFLTIIAVFLVSCADTRDCICLREMPIENNPLVIPKDLDGNPLTIPIPQE